MIASTMYVMSQVIIPGRIIIRNRDTVSCRVECRYLLTTDYYQYNDAMFVRATQAQGIISCTIIQSLFISAANWQV